MRLGLHTINDNERPKGSILRTGRWYLSPTVGKRYLGTLAKGWWSFGNRRIWRHFGIHVAVGGEDNMLQVELVIPCLAAGAVGVRVPRVLTRGWIHERREWGVRLGYIGRWLDVHFGFDSHLEATGMSRYYAEKRARGEDVQWSRLETWQGIELTFHPRPIERLLGQRVYVSETVEEVRTVVPMPEGNYPCTVKLNIDTWKRPRWPWPKAMRRADVKLDVPIPVPGKGEDSYNCEDDAFYSSYGPAATVPQAIARLVGDTLRERDRYARLDWTPTAGWPDGIEKRVAA